MVTEFPPLLDILKQIPDPRHARGKRHPLHAILAMMCVAALCGRKTYSAMSEWGRQYGSEWVRFLGFTRDETPSKSTLCYLLRRLDIVALESKLNQWAEAVLTLLPPAEKEDEAFALDGKCLRGSRKQGARFSYLLAVLGHRLGITLFQQAVPVKTDKEEEKTNEIPVVERLLKGLFQEGRLKGRIWTMDALHTQRKNAETIVKGEGDYVMLVKGNQGALLEDIRLVFQDPSALRETKDSAETWDAGHGRIESRRITTSTVLKGYLDWPGAEQVFCIERKTWLKKQQRMREHVVYGVTSLSPKRADPEHLLNLIRCHWHIENRLHWVRDVTYDEDRSQVRSGAIPEVVAAIRNVAISLIRLAGELSIATANRYFQAKPRAAVALIGASMDN